MTDPDEVRNMVCREITASSRRDYYNALVKGLVDGNPPFTQSEIDKQGQRYRSNFNTGEPMSYLSIALTGFYDLFTEVETFATVECEMQDPKASEWSRIMTEEYDRMVRRDRTRDFHNQVSQHDMVLYGSGPIVWMNEFDWRSRHARHVDVLYPRNAPSNVDDMELVIFRHTFTTAQLYGFMHNEEIAKARGWNPDTLKKAIAQAASENENVTGTDWVKEQQRLRNNDLAHASASKTIDVARVLYREYPLDGEETGEISECWVLSKKSAPGGFLFRKVRRFKDWRNCFNPFFYDKGDGTAHSVKGLGVRMFKMLLAMMRLENATVDTAFASAALMFKATTPKAFAQGGMVHFGPYTVLDPGMDFVQVQNTGRLDGSLAVSRHLDLRLSSNLSQFRQKLERSEGTPRTATENRIQAAQASQVGKTQFARYYEQRDDYEAETFRRAARFDLADNVPGQRQAKEFRDRSLARGVPEEAFSHVRVTATRAVGQGNPFVRQAMLESMEPSSLSWPDAGRIALQKDIIAHKAGMASVKRYYPEMGSTPQQLEQQAEAMQENTSFRVGNEAVWTPLQDNLIHATVHIIGMTQALQTAEKGADQQEIIRFVDAAGPNVAIHLQKLSTDRLRQQEFKALEEQFKEIGTAADKLRGQINQDAQAQQQVEQTAGESVTRMHIERATAAERARLAREEMEAEQRRKDAELQHKLARADAETAHKITTAE
ncbi:MAG: hypothetical protein ACE5HE_00205 [Phycisphaerae bacterium]